mgnify:FL=1
MHIFDDVVWGIKEGREHIWINKPCDFYSLPGSPNIADTERANRVSDESLLKSRLDKIEMAKKDGSIKECKIALADKASRLRGYAGGLAYVAKFKEMEPLLFLPQRGIYSRGDRLVWDICAGKTTMRSESPNWLHGIIVEGLKELSIVHDYKLLLPQVTGTNVDIVTKAEANGIINKHASQLLHLHPFSSSEVNMQYVPPLNAARVHQTLEDGSLIEFDAGWGVEAKYSGLELMAYGLIDFGMHYTSNLFVYDSEELMPNEISNREIHEIRPATCIIFVYRAGCLSRISNLRNEIASRNRFRKEYDYSNDRPGLVPIPDYTATSKADRLTKQGSWPFGTNIDKLKVLEYRG